VRDVAFDASGGPGDGVFRTTNCGDTWAEVTPSPLRGHLGIITLTAVDAEHAWLISWKQSGTPTVVDVWRTADGGASWQHTDVAVRPQGDPTITFDDRQHGWMAIPVSGLSSRDDLRARLYATRDGGATWTPVTGELPGGAVPVAGVMFTDLDHGWGVPDPSQGGARLYRTTDGGHSWTPAALAAPQGFTGSVEPVGLPIFSDPRNGLLPVRLGTASDPFPVAGGAGSARLDLYVTRDGGSTWTPTTPLSGVPDISAFAVSPSVGVLSSAHWMVTTESTLWTTDDAGMTWTSRPSVMGLPASQGALYPTTTIVGSAYPTPRSWWIVYEPLGCDEGCDSYGVMHTVDGGTTWVEEEQPDPAGST
jgi:photosystem II stability/assembly factor-like uncharacterized protein